MQAGKPEAPVLKSLPPGDSGGRGCYTTGRRRDYQTVKALVSLIAPAVLLLGCVAGLNAQNPRVSPHEEVSKVVGGKTITVTYGRPYMKGRKIFGGLEPYGKVWRVGADEATTFTTTGDLMFGSLHVPAGTYAMFVTPGETEWTIILNKVAKTWGAYDYDKNKAQDLGQVTVKADKLPAPHEQLTIAIEPAGEKKATLEIIWEQTRVSVPLQVH